MTGEENKKRHRNDGRYKRRHDRNKFRKTTNATQERKDLGSGLQGILFSCTPHHENQAFREAVIMLGKYIPDTPKSPPAPAPPALLPTPTDAVDSASKQGESRPEAAVAPASAPLPAAPAPGVVDVTQALQAELKEMRDPAQKLFTRVDAGVNGSVFVRVNRADVHLERVVGAALREARASGSPNARHCIRILPVHTTCYAKPEDAAKAAVEVVREHFPAVGEGAPVSYAIAFKARLNSGAHREEFITEIAKGINEYEAAYKVDLTKPDVTLIVEVLKTSCCIGTFREYYQLAKMNLREAACPTKPKNNGAVKAVEEAVEKAKNGIDESGQKSGAGVDRSVEEKDEEATGKRSDGDVVVDNAADKLQHEKVERASEEPQLETGSKAVTSGVEEKSGNEVVAAAGGGSASDADKGAPVLAEKAAT